MGVTATRATRPVNTLDESVLEAASTTLEASMVSGRPPRWVRNSPSLAQSMRAALGANTANVIVPITKVIAEVFQPPRVCVIGCEVRRVVISGKRRLIDLSARTTTPANISNMRLKANAIGGRAR